MRRIQFLRTTQDGQVSLGFITYNPHTAALTIDEPVRHLADELWWRYEVDLAAPDPSHLAEALDEAPFIYNGAYLRAVELDANGSVLPYRGQGKSYHNPSRPPRRRRSIFEDP
jgi:hypothetical protein